MPNNCVCGVCMTRLKKGQGRKINSFYREYFTNILHRPIDNDKLICLKCRKLYSQRNKNVNNTPTKDTSRKENRNIILPFVSVGKTKSHCILCKHKGKGLRKMPSEVRIQIFVQQGVIIPLGMSCCSSHLYGPNLKPGVSVHDHLMTKTQSHVTTEELTVLLNGLRNIASKCNTIDFDNNAMTSEQLYDITGLYREQFDDICSLNISMKKSKNRSVRQAIGMLLMKLRTGLSDRVIGTLCGFDKRRKVAHIIGSGRSALVKDFVPSYLGFDHVTRETVLENHTTDLATQLFSNFLSDSVILVMDGTYIYIQKSAKHQFQRKCFSMHKYRPLIKPMMITTTTGYIVSVIGPYFSNGKNNDASITEHIFRTNADNISTWMKQEDILILDRGFRDVLPFLDQIGIETHSPAFLGKGEKQMSTENANSSRLVTKLRWVVEGVNGRIKTWGYIDKVIPNKDLPNVWDYISIVAALCNKYKPPLRTTIDSDCDIARNMIMLASSENVIHKRVMKDKNVQRRAKYWKGIPITSPDAVPDFPTLSESDLRTLTFGVYQVKQARNYTDEHIINGTSDLFVHSEAPDLVHARIQSRHTTAKQHNMWVQFSASEITGWYCECRAGARTVGCCSHIATIIWYLSFARHIKYDPKSENYSKLILDATNIPSSGESDESDL